MKKQQQLFTLKNRSAFGGSLLKNSHAKRARPHSAKMSMHVVLKARKSCLKHYDRRIEAIIERQARRHYIKVYNIQNVGNHIHLVIRTSKKFLLSNFLRATTGLISRKLNAIHLWEQRPFSRIVKWGKAFKTIQNYMTVNKYQSQGFTRQQARFMMEMDIGLYSLDYG